MSKVIYYIPEDKYYTVTVYKHYLYGDIIYEFNMPPSDTVYSTPQDVYVRAPWHPVDYNAAIQQLIDFNSTKYVRDGFLVLDDPRTK